MTCIYTDLFEDSIGVQEAARLLGVSRPTVYRLIENGKLTARAHAVTGRKLLSRQGGSGAGSGSAAGSRRGGGSGSGGSAGAADSIFRLPELALELPVDDVSERIDYYCFHGLPEDAKSVPGHVRPGSGEHAD